jgi:hypothetical protein
VGRKNKGEGEKRGRNDDGQAWGGGGDGKKRGRRSGEVKEPLTSMNFSNSF